MVRLEETIKELKGLGRKNLAMKQGLYSNDSINKPYHVRWLSEIFFSL